MVRAVRREIDRRDHAAGGIDPRGEPLGEFPAIERLGTTGGDGMERRGEVGLLEHLAGARPATAWTEDPRCLLVVGEALALGGDRGGGGVASVAKRGEPRGGGEVMSARDQAVGGADRGTGGQTGSMLRREGEQNA